MLALHLAPTSLLDATAVGPSSALFLWASPFASTQSTDFRIQKPLLRDFSCRRHLPPSPCAIGHSRRPPPGRAAPDWLQPQRSGRASRCSWPSEFGGEGLGLGSICSDSDQALMPLTVRRPPGPPSSGPGRRPAAQSKTDRGGGRQGRLWRCGLHRCAGDRQAPRASADARPTGQRLRCSSQSPVAGTGFEPSSARLRPPEEPRPAERRGRGSVPRRASHNPHLCADAAHGAPSPQGLARALQRRERAGRARPKRAGPRRQRLDHGGRPGGGGPCRRGARQALRRVVRRCT